MSGKADLDAWAAGQACPCGYTGLRIEWGLRARPMGEFSLAGHQLKASAVEVPILVCPGCGQRAEGKRA